ncbi:hypothetical protein EV127DRAFT_196708 [Xylaria flabelliformis]|nr:hypothetical protein EV127DRAFT_196708 [Xylaria flabelliformis]
MMTFDSNAALYPQYKKDTKIVAQWLDQTSKTLGFSSSRKQRQAGVKKQYTICIADFKLMAEFLSLKEHVFMPPYVRTSLSRAIHYRSTYGSYLQLQRHTNTGRNTTEDQKHLFFIDVLRKVQRILSRISQPTAPVALQTQTTPTATKAAARPVTVEDDTEDHVSTPTRTETSSDSLGTGVIFEPWEEDEEEALFQWRLFNMDVQRIRKQIRPLWELYRAGHLSLEGVATAHNIAVHVVRRMEQDIHPVFEKYGGYVNLSKAHFVQRYVGTAAEEEIEARVARLQSEDGVIIGPTVDSIIDGFDIAEEEMVFAWQVLFSEIWAWNRCGSFGHYNGKWGEFKPRNDRSIMTNLEKYEQDKAVACGVVHDLQILAIYLNPSVGMRLDGLAAAIEDLVPWRMKDTIKHLSKQFPSQNGKITFRAVFATQLLLDSIHVLGTSVDRPCGELLEKTARIFKSAKSLREFYEGPGALALGPLPGASYVENIEIAAKFWQGEDPITEFRREAQAKPSKPLTKRAYSLLKHNASLCGWWIQTLRATSYSCSITIAKSISLPLACARLYFAFVQERLVPKGSWPDMDAFSILHRGDLWVGIAPKSGQYLQNLMLAGGNSIVGLASDSRVNSRTFRTERVKSLTSSAKVSKRINEAFVERNVEGLSEEDLERLITDTKLRWYAGKAVKPCFHHGWDKAGNHKGDLNCKTDNHFLRLAQAIDAETLEQSFDYMSLNRVCWIVLRELVKKGPPILNPVGGPHSAKPAWERAEGNNARLIVGFIFFVVFLPDGTVRRQEASVIADILLNLIKPLGRVVHTSTGIDWNQALKCTCADIQILN